MEKIIIKNFGPIKDVELEIKDINVFIGSTSSGKSTVAKLIAIFKEFGLRQVNNFMVFTSLLNHYNINFDINDKTHIKYKIGNLYWELRSKKVATNYPLRSVPYGFNQNFRKLVSDLRNIDMKSVKEDDESKGKFMELLFHFIDLEFSLIHGIDSYNERIEKTILLNKKVDKARKDIKLGDYSSLSEIVSEAEKHYLFIFKELKPEEVIYIPAERILLSMVAESLFGLMNNDVAIAKCIKDFGAQFESARKKIDSFSIPFLNSEYSYSDKSNFVTFSDGAKVKLEQASSGLQSIIPLLLVVESNTTGENAVKNCFVIEEPELNLYPIVQKKLIEFIIERINKSKDKLIITTHSPYVLTSLDNLIQASNAAKINPEQKKKVAEIVPEGKWVDFNRVACYYFEDGTCRSTLDTENQTIGASNIDDVSEELGKTFDQLLELKYAHVS